MKAKQMIVGAFTLEEMATLYLAKCGRLAAESVRTYQVGLRAAARASLEGECVALKSAHEVTVGWAQQAYDAVREVSGDATADKWVKCVAAAHRWHEQRGVALPPSPWSAIERAPASTYDIVFPDNWVTNMLELVAEASGKLLPPRVADFYTLCISTGARPWCELLPLRWEHVSERGVVFTNSKRKKKQRRKVRTLPLELLCGRARDALERQRSESPWVWPGGRNGDSHTRHAGESTIGKHWTVFREWARERIMIEDLDGELLDLYRWGRHGFASHCRDMGMAPHVIADLLGHGTRTRAAGTCGSRRAWSRPTKAPSGASSTVKQAALTDAQELALCMLPVEVGAWGAPRKSTLRVLIRRGLAKEFGDESPTTIVPTPEGRELRRQWREAAES